MSVNNSSALTYLLRLLLNKYLRVDSHRDSVSDYGQQLTNTTGHTRCDKNSTKSLADIAQTSWS